jgi:hypothetical protein
MRMIVIGSLVLAVQITPALAASHLTAVKMLEDAALNHDLAKMRMTFEHDVKSRYISRSRESSLGMADSKR